MDLARVSVAGMMKTGYSDDTVYQPTANGYYISPWQMDTGHGAEDIDWLIK